MIDFVPTYLDIALASMTPIIESRGAVIIGIAYGLPPVWTILVATLANFAITFVWLLFLKFAVVWVRSWHPTFDKFFDWLFTKTHQRHSAKFERWSFLALTLFIAIPLPISGAYTGAILAYLFGIKLNHAAAAMIIGIFLAAVIAAAIALGGVAVLSL